MNGEWQWWLEGRQQITIQKESPGENKKSEIKVICQANENDVGSQKKEEDKGSAMNQQSRELVKKWVRYVENKK